MVLYDVIQTARLLNFSLCVTKHEDGFYFPAVSHLRGAILRELGNYEVCIFTIDFENKVVFARLKGEIK